jgi:DNA-binding MarR family transcriptional regulator
MIHEHGLINMPKAPRKNQKNTGPTVVELALQLHGNLRRTLEPIGLAPLQAGVLCYLHRHADAGAGDTATALRVQPPTLSQVVHQLARKGWVTTRRSTEDRRVVCLRLTRKGEALVREITQLIGHVGASLTKNDTVALGITTPQNPRA